MRNMKKLVSVIAAVSMAASMMAACGGSSAPATTAAPAATTKAAATTAAPAATTKAAAATTAAATTKAAAATTAAAKSASGDFVKYNDIKGSLGPIKKSDKAINIGFTAKALENEFWRMEADGAEAAGKAFKDAGMNVTITVAAANGESDVQGQESVMKDMINKKYDGIMVAPISDSNLTAAIEDAQSKKIPMIYVNDKDGNVDLPIVGADHKDTAELAAEWIAKKIGGKGQVAIVQGLPTAEAARLRTDCFVDYMKAKYPDIQVVAKQNADWDRTKAKDVASTILKQYPDLKAIYANNDTMVMGVLEAVKDADKLHKVLLVGTDGTSEALASIKAGELDATVNDFPYFQSQVAAEMLVRRLNGQEVPAKIYSPHAVVDSENCNKTNEEILGWTGFKVE